MNNKNLKRNDRPHRRKKARISFEERCFGEHCHHYLLGILSTQARVEFSHKYGYRIARDSGTDRETVDNFLLLDTHDPDAVRSQKRRPSDSETLEKITPVLTQMVGERLTFEAHLSKHRHFSVTEPTLTKQVLNWMTDPRYKVNSVMLEGSFFPDLLGLTPLAAIPRVSVLLPPPELGVDRQAAELGCNESILTGAMERTRNAAEIALRASKEAGTLRIYHSPAKRPLTLGRIIIEFAHKQAIELHATSACGENESPSVHLNSDTSLGELHREERRWSKYRPFNLN